MADARSESSNSHPEKEAKAPNVNVGLGGKEEMKSSIYTEKSPSHDNETHGTSNDIDEDTPIDKVKGPGILERAKEEIEAIVEAIHPKK